MTRSGIVERLQAEQVIPVLRYESAELTKRAVDCLQEVGFGVVEITLTTPGALPLIAELSKRKNFVVGAGTVLDAHAGEECLKAGAQFLVSPYVCQGLARVAHDAGKAALVAGFTPTEVMAAHREGADIVKVFPVSTGGPSHLAHLHSVYPHILLCPTGGISLANMQQYFDAGACAVGVGSTLLPLDALKKGDLHVVKAHAAQYKGKHLA